MAQQQKLDALFDNLLGDHIAKPEEAAPKAPEPKKEEKEANLNVQVGDYFISDFLGKGTFSIVYLGVNTKTKQKYAVKVFDKHVFADKRRQELLRREVKVMKCLDHPHVVKLIEVLQSAKAIFLVIELMEGQSLGDVIKEGPQSEDQARQLFHQIVAGIQHCHNRNVAHRDLKPENILFDGQGNIKIADFGLSKLQSLDNSYQQSLCGTPYYLAPEVVSDQVYSGFKVDIWALGALLYLLVSGQKPFTGRNLPQLFQNIQNGIFQCPKFFSKDLKDLISQTLVVDSKQRITMAKFIAHPWFQVNLPKQIFEPISKDPVELEEGHESVASSVGNPILEVNLADDAERAVAQRPRTKPVAQV